MVMSVGILGEYNLYFWCGKSVDLVWSVCIVAEVGLHMC